MSAWRGRDAASVGDAGEAEAEEGLWNLDEDEVDNEPPLLVMKPIPSSGDEEVMGTGVGMGMGGMSSAPSRANSLPGSKHASPRKGISVGGSPLAATQSLQVPIPMNLGPAFSASPRIRSRDLSPERRSPGTGAISTPADTPTGQAAEYLKFLAEHAKNVNIVMELSLEDQEVQYINNAINEVTGRAPEDVLFSPITEILHPDDSASFATATKTLLSDPEGTVQLRVRFGIKKVVDSFTWTESHRPDGEVFIELEGVGMLMKELDEPSHTMWVLKAVPANSSNPDGVPEVSFLVNDQISTEEVLCRICERGIAAWFFEKHNDTCDALHRLEADIAECGECLGDLRDTVLAHMAQLDQPAEESEHKGLLLLTLPESVTAGDNGIPIEPQLVQRRNITRSQLEDVAEILQIAKDIRTPSVGEDETDMPFYLQRYLDPESEENLARISKWRPPQTTDRALAMLFGHVEEQIRRKQKAVARMQSTIRYSEKTRHEWEDKVNTVLADLEGSGSSGDESGAESPTLADSSVVTAASALSAGANTTVGTVGTGSGTTLGGDKEGEPGESPPGHRRIAPQARLPVTMSHPGRPGTAAEPPTPYPQSVAPSRSRSATTKDELKAYSTIGTPVSLAAAAQRAAAAVLSPNKGPSSSSTPFSGPSPAAIAAAVNAAANDEDDPSPKSMPTSQVPKPMSIPMPPMHKGPFKQITPVASPLLSPLLAPSDYPTRHVRRPSRAMRDAPLSPRIPSAALSRPPPPSIKDFEIIKPISRGAFGSVFLAKKTTTGDYYAIKALKKSDMIAKNQITNVKAERTILINQASSPHVAKLFFSFQSKEYLYLVMEYLNGGDCANLVKTLHSLPEEWARNYCAEVVLGLEYMHGRGIVHRDIKPDNLLIDSRGHLKLTDFGLSRMGLINRQGGAQRPLHLRRASARELRQRPLISRTGSASSNESPLLSPDYLPPPSGAALSQSYFNPIHDPGSADESSGSESVGVLPKHVRHLSIATSMSSEPASPGVTAREPSNNMPMQPPPKFVGTPDYLAPESILGIGADDSAVDWWALGVVLYEFLYGIPPFHDESPEKVFDNVVSRRINWHEDEVEISPQARDLMEKLMCSNPSERLGAKGAQEVKDHPFFEGVEWDTIMESEASFVPEVTDPESTDYFDSRGAIHDFHDEDPAPTVLRGPGQNSPPSQATGRTQSNPQSRSQSQSVYPSPSAGTINRLGSIVADLQAERERAEKEEFGAFNFKNLPVLKQANDDMIRKLRRESMSQMSSSSAMSAPLDSGSGMSAQQRPRSVSAKMRLKRPNDVVSISTALGTSVSGPSTGSAGSNSAPQSASVPSGNLGMGFQGMGMNFMGLGMGLAGAPPSPSTSTSSAASTPSRSSAAPLTPNMVMPIPIGSASNSPSSATSSSLAGGAGPHVQVQNALHGHSLSTGGAHFRRPSELSVSALDRVKGTEDSDLLRRASAPFRVRAGSGGSISDRSTSMEMWRQRRQASLQTDAAGVEKLALGAGGEGPKDRDRDRDRDRGDRERGSGPIPISIHSSGGPMTNSSAAWPSPSTSISISAAGSDAGHSPDSTMSGIGLGPAYSGSLIAGYGYVDRTLDVLIAEDNPISQKILETLLTRMGCRCVCVEDGPQALAATMGSIRFDVIFCDMHMPVVNGEQVARMIRSTNNHNQNTPIVAATSYEQDFASEGSASLFSAVLAKPVSKSDLTACLARLGFVFASTITSMSGSAIDEGSMTG